MAVLGAGAVLLALTVIGTRHGVFTPDTRPDLYMDPGRFLRSTVQAWVPGSTGLGQGNFNAGAAPVAAVVWVIRTLGAPAWLAVRIWRLALLLLGAWGIRRYLGALFGKRLSVQARVLATAFWVVNPYVIVSGSTTPILLPYALLPWTMLAFLHATRSPRSWCWPAVFGLAFFAQTGMNAGVVPFFQLLALPGHIAFARWVEGRSWRDLWTVLWRCATTSIAVSLYWLLPSVLASGTGAAIASTTEDPVDVARTSSYSEAARLLGNWPLYGRAGARLFMGSYTVYLTSALVLISSFLVPIAVGVGLWRSKAKERFLVVGLMVFSLPVMVGLFPPDDRYPAADLLLAVFERVPATMAFRTTNKVGAVLVLAETIGIVIAWRLWQARTIRRSRNVQLGAISLVLVLLIPLSLPMWNGGLYPLGFNIPSTWKQAARDLDKTGSDARVFVLPGGSGGNYRWGMRSPDDLFPSILNRPIVVRSTVVGRGDPSGNMLSAIDTAVAQGAGTRSSISTAARYLGADQVLIRNDLLTEEIGGPPPSRVVAQAEGDAGLDLVSTYGKAGVDTIPGLSGTPTKDQRDRAGADAKVYPLNIYDVKNPGQRVAIADTSDQVLVVGDGQSFVALSQLGIVDGAQPVRYVADLGDKAFANAVAAGGRVVLTDTNRRRAWDVNRAANATSPTLDAHGDIDAGSGATTTLWPDNSDHQSVSELTGGVRVGSSRPRFGFHPFGRSSNAFDGDPTTAWLSGGLSTAAGSTIWIDLPQRQRIEQITLHPANTEPSSVMAVRVRVGSKKVIEAITPGVPAKVDIQPSVADRVEVTILDQSEGANPVGFTEIDIDGLTLRDVTRVPLTLGKLTTMASSETRRALRQLPFDVVLTRERGTVEDHGDDEEAQLNRRFELVDARRFSFAAELSTTGADPELVQRAKDGETGCEQVALLDGDWLTARITSTNAELDAGTIRLEGCEPLDLSRGSHELQTVFGWRLDQVHLASAGSEPLKEPSETEQVKILRRSATTIEMAIGESNVGERVLRLGEAWDPRWTLSIDGKDAGLPIVVDGYSSGWLIGPGSHRLVAHFTPQRAVEVSFVASAAGLVGVSALAVVPVNSLVPPVVRIRRRTKGDPAPGAGPNDRDQTNPEQGLKP